MSQDLLTERVSDIREGLLREFAAHLPAEAIQRCFQESWSAYRDARVTDFVPLFLQRDMRTRIEQLLTETRTAGAA